jgi:hypothetical protein
MDRDFSPTGDGMAIRRGASEREIERQYFPLAYQTRDLVAFDPRRSPFERRSSRLLPLGSIPAPQATVRQLIQSVRLRFWRCG